LVGHLILSTDRRLISMRAAAATLGSFSVPPVEYFLPQRKVFNGPALPQFKHLF
jgi:hypothetical protein